MILIFKHFCHNLLRNNDVLAAKLADGSANFTDNCISHWLRITYYLLLFIENFCEISTLKNFFKF